MSLEYDLSHNARLLLHNILNHVHFSHTLLICLQIRKSLFGQVAAWWLKSYSIFHLVLGFSRFKLFRVWAWPDTGLYKLHLMSSSDILVSSILSSCFPFPFPFSQIILFYQTCRKQCYLIIRSTVWLYLYCIINKKSYGLLNRDKNKIGRRGSFNWMMKWLCFLFICWLEYDYVICSRLSLKCPLLSTMSQ